MQNIEKANIGGMAFTLEEEAFVRMSGYLEELAEHYRSGKDRNELLEEIEARIAELLTDRGYKEKIVPTEVVNEIIGILGKPEDIGTDDPAYSGDAKGQRKRLYRNPENKVVGGVCGGLGAYFSCDPVFLRLIFALWTLSVVWIEDDFYWIPRIGFVLYLILWISMPLARTMEQRYSMYGDSVSLDNIQKRFRYNKKHNGNDRVQGRSAFWDTFARAALLVTGMLLFFSGLAGTVVMLLAIIGVGAWACFTPLSISWVFSVFANAPLWISTLYMILISLVCILPALAMLYGGILILFRLKSPKWRPGLIMFITWVVSLLAVIFLTIGFASELDSTQTYRESATLETRDTLFIEFTDCGKWDGASVCLEADTHSMDLVYMGKNEKGTFLAVYPTIVVARTNELAPEIHSSTQVFTASKGLQEFTGKPASNFWSCQGRTLKVEPSVFYSGHRPENFNNSLWIRVSPDMEVVVREPVEHQFKGRIEFCNSNFLRKLKEL